MDKIISILGCTGSIGTQALDVCRAHNFKVCGLSAHSNIELLEKQIREFKPRKVCVYNEQKAEELRKNISDLDIEVLTGMEGLCQLAKMEEANIVLNSVVGMIGLVPTLEALKAKKDVALANKETLVTGGQIVIQTAKENGVNIYPVDSEHSAIFQALQGNECNKIKKIWLTASGGPFFGKTLDDLKKVTKADALAHPNWSMGQKITIDSATLMNKGLELIEAVWLFNLDPTQVEIVVHRESVIHSAVEYEDNSVIAQLGVPDMKIPIQYALTYPNRYPCPCKELSIFDYGKLTFYKPDIETFICLKACIKAIKMGGLMPTVVNGANEQAVALFLEGKISFVDIGNIVYKSLNLIENKHNFTVQDIINTDKIAREYVLSQVK